MELSQEAPQAVVDLPQPADHSLADAIKDTLLRLRPSALADTEQIDQAARDQADAVMALLIEGGHVIPGAPPAMQILRDAQSFAERLTLSNLACRILNMLAFSNVQTPETKPARQWIDDYLEGRNHGPIGQPMLWPGRLPGMASLLRDWGFMPTIAVPGQPSYVARNVAPPTKQ
jgi:hypothetical protein